MTGQYELPPRTASPERIGESSRSTGSDCVAPGEMVKRTGRCVSLSLGDGVRAVLRLDIVSHTESPSAKKENNTSTDCAAPVHSARTLTHVNTSHSLTPTHSHSLPLTLTHSHSLSLTLTHSHSLSPTLTHSHSLTHSLTLTHSHPLSLTDSLTLTHSHPLSPTLTHSHSLSLTLTLTHFHSLSRERASTVHSTSARDTRLCICVGAGVSLLCLVLQGRPAFCPLRSKSSVSLLDVREHEGPRWTRKEVRSGPFEGDFALMFFFSFPFFFLKKCFSFSVFLYFFPRSFIAGINIRV